MNGFGFTDAINYSFISEKACDYLRYPAEDRRRRCVRVLNPLSEDQGVMRTSLLPGLLENVRSNAAQQVKSLRFFEAGRIYLARDEGALPEEREMLAGLWAGLRSEATWHSKPLECDFYDLKGVVESLFEALRMDGVKYVRMPDADCIELRPGSAARILLDGDEPVGIIGELHPESVRQLGLKQTVYIFEIDLARIYDRAPESKKICPVPKFPAIFRDITIIVDQNIEAQRIISQARAQKSELVEDLCLLDVFQGDPIAPGKKSASMRVTYRSNIKTLDDEDIRLLHESITRGIMDAFGATLPA
jgi:phenylalanyl-tRNA synthetase beta chain